MWQQSLLNGNWKTGSVLYPHCRALLHPKAWFSLGYSDTIPKALATKGLLLCASVLLFSLKENDSTSSILLTLVFIHTGLAIKSLMLVFSPHKRNPVILALMAFKNYYGLCNIRFCSIELTDKLIQPATEVHLVHLLQMELLSPLFCTEQPHEWKHFRRSSVIFVAYQDSAAVNYLWTAFRHKFHPREYLTWKPSVLCCF